MFIVKGSIIKSFAYYNKRELFFRPGSPISGQFLLSRSKATKKAGKALQYQYNIADKTAIKR